MYDWLKFIASWIVAIAIVWELDVIRCELAKIRAKLPSKAQREDEARMGRRP